MSAKSILIFPTLALSVWSDPQGEVRARMLFDHRKDPRETVNVADDPAYARTVESLERVLRMGKGSD